MLTFRKHRLRLVLVGSMLLAIGTAARARDGRLLHVSVGGVVQAPTGWSGFCTEYPDQCQGTSLHPREIVKSQTAWRDLLKINHWVNNFVTPMTDMEHWGKVEKWSLPTDGRGDCEDYALLKRKMLMDAGWPREALLMTVVRDEDGEGHAVLTIVTDKGDFVLDNKNETVLPWAETGYHFVKRQSQNDPNVWVVLDDGRPAVTITSKGN